MGVVRKVRKLNPAQAEAVVDDLIQTYGLGAYPKVKVSALPSGDWEVRWDGRSMTTEPMTAKKWAAWLRRQIGSISPHRLETLEG